MINIDYHTQVALGKVDLDGWTVVALDDGWNGQTYVEHSYWLNSRPSGGRYFLQPMAGAYWFEDSQDALLYHIMFGGHTPHVHDRTGIKKAMQC